MHLKSERRKRWLHPVPPSTHIYPTFPLWPSPLKEHCTPLMICKKKQGSQQEIEGTLQLRAIQEGLIEGLFINMWAGWKEITRNSVVPWRWYQLNHQKLELAYFRVVKKKKNYLKTTAGCRFCGMRHEKFMYLLFKFRILLIWCVKIVVCVCVMEDFLCKDIPYVLFLHYFFLCI